MVSDDNIRFSVTVSKDIHSKLKEIAEKEHRNVSNTITHIICLYFESKEGDKNND